MSETTALEPTADVVVVGAGLAGLTCADALSRAALDVLLLEADDAPGGRVRTERVDGFRVDRGFQLLNPAYPAAQRLLDLDALRLQPFPAGVVIRRGGRLHVLADPRRASADLVLRTLLSGATALGGAREKAAFARWAVGAAYGDVATALAAPDEPWRQGLDRLGVDRDLRRAVLEPFLAGTLAEDDGSTSRRFVELLLRSFVRGTPAVPWEGMQAMPEQLAARLPAGVVLRTGVRVVGVDRGTAPTVTTTLGAVRARAVVVATDPRAAEHLTGVAAPAMRGLTTFWWVAPVAPSRWGALHVDGDRSGPVVNTVVQSTAAPSYSPDDRALVAATVLGGDGGTAAEAAARAHAGRIYGTPAASWELVATHAIPQALTAMPPPLDVRRPVDLGDGLFVAGDHRDTASIQGALVSGRRAARAVLRTLGAAVPAALIGGDRG